MISELRRTASKRSAEIDFLEAELAKVHFAANALAAVSRLSISAGMTQDGAAASPCQHSMICCPLLDTDALTRRGCAAAAEGAAERACPHDVCRAQGNVCLSAALAALPGAFSRVDMPSCSLEPTVCMHARMHARVARLELQSLTLPGALTPSSQVASKTGQPQMWAERPELGCD